jgi:hypothetical protein
MEVICILRGGPDYWISVGNKLIRFEDHPYCGPIVLQGKTGDPSENQPPERDKFWLHYDAWVKAGKPTKKVLNKVWCDSKTDLQKWRASIAKAAP